MWRIFFEVTLSFSATLKGHHLLKSLSYLSVASSKYEILSQKVPSEHRQTVVLLCCGIVSKGNFHRRFRLKDLSVLPLDKTRRF